MYFCPRTIRHDDEALADSMPSSASAELGTMCNVQKKRRKLLSWFSQGVTGWDYFSFRRTVRRSWNGWLVVVQTHA